MEPYLNKDKSIMETAHKMVPVGDQHHDLRHMITNQFRSLNSTGSDTLPIITSSIENHLNHWTHDSESFPDQYSSKSTSLCSVCYSDQTYACHNQTGSNDPTFVESNHPDQIDYYQNLANYTSSGNPCVNPANDFKNFQQKQIDHLIKNPLNQLQAWLQHPIMEPDYNCSPMFFRTSLKNLHESDDLKQNPFSACESYPRINIHEETVNAPTTNYNLSCNSSSITYPETFESTDGIQSTPLPNLIPVTSTDPMHFKGTDTAKSGCHLKDNDKETKNTNSKRSRQAGHIKKPLNAFMLFMKEMRAQVIAECTLKESAAINQILGRKWHALSREAQAKYYKLAKQEKELHQRLYPGWSARDNYATQVRRRTRTATTTTSYSELRTSNTNYNVGKSNVSTNDMYHFPLSNKIWTKQPNHMDSFSNTDVNYLRISQPSEVSVKSTRSSCMFPEMYKPSVNCEISATTPLHSHASSSDRLFTSNPSLETVLSFHSTSSSQKSNWPCNFVSGDGFPISNHNSANFSIMRPNYSCDRIVNSINYPAQPISKEDYTDRQDIDTACGSPDDESDISTNLTPENIFEGNTNYSSTGNNQFRNPLYAVDTMNQHQSDYETPKNLLSVQTTVSTSLLEEALNPCPCCDTSGYEFYTTTVYPSSSYHMNEMNLQSSHEVYKGHAIKNAAL